MNSQVCIDATIVIWSLVTFPLSNIAGALLRTWQETETTLIAPTLLAFEVTATLRRLVYLKEITPAEGDDVFARFLRLEIQLSSRQDIFPLAWELAKQFNRSRAYDTAYLALAQLNQCDFWTADEKLYNAVRAKLPWVKWIGDYAHS
jgi:predicted nucleic acid-binding protein